jgi:hypothetical protein
MALRRVVLDNFSEAVIRKGQPLAKIEDALVPAYLMHRYQVQAAATVLGGKDFTYALKGDDQMPTTVIDGERQQAALTALLATMSPEALALTPELVAVIPPRPPMSGDSKELFPRKTGYSFDPVAAAGTAAELTLRTLLDPARAERLIQQKADDPNLLSFSDVLAELIAATGLTSGDITFIRAQSQVAQRVQTQVVARLMTLARHSAVAEGVRADAAFTLAEIFEYLAGNAKNNISKIQLAGWQAHYHFLEQQIRLFQNDAEPWQTGSSVVPPGSPI